MRARAAGAAAHMAAEMGRHAYDIADGVTRVAQRVDNGHALRGHLLAARLVERLELGHAAHGRSCVKRRDAHALRLVIAQLLHERTRRGFCAAATITVLTIVLVVAVGHLHALARGGERPLLLECRQLSRHLQATTLENGVYS